MMATLVVRPLVAVRLSLLRSSSFQYGLNELTGVSELRFLYGLPGVASRKSSASRVPKTKFDAGCAGTPGQPNCSMFCGGANGLQNGNALTWSFSCGSVSLVPWP